MRAAIIFSGFLGLIVGVWLGAWAAWPRAQSAARMWRNRALEAERQRDNFKQGCDERGEFISHLMSERLEQYAKEEEWPDEIAG